MSGHEILDYKSTIRDAVLELASVGSFVAHGKLDPSHDPQISIAGVGRLVFPLHQQQISDVIACMEQAPFGMGSATVVDLSVRTAWQLDASKLTTGTHWTTEFLPQIVAKACDTLSVDSWQLGVEARLYKLLCYQKGGHFKKHRDTEKEPGMFGTLIVQLRSAHQGGDLIVEHKGEIKRLNFAATSEDDLHFVAFFADCEHSLEPVLSGTRLVLAYNLVRTKVAFSLPTAEHALRLRNTLLSAVRAWEADAHGPSKLAVVLDHQYTKTNLSFEGLKGGDKVKLDMFRTVRDSTGSALFEVVLCLVEKYESGEAVCKSSDCNHDGEDDETFYESRLRHGHDEDSDDDFKNAHDDDYHKNAHSMGEVSDSLARVDMWVGPSGSVSLPFSTYGEILTLDDDNCSIFGEEVEPSHKRYERYMGNYGPTLEYFYHKALIVIWPKSTTNEMLIREMPRENESSNPFLGRRISLVTKAGARYEGKLYTVITDDAEPSVTLSGVRVKSTSDPSAVDKLFAFITFKTSEIEDLQVLENAGAPVALASAGGLHTPAQVGGLQQQKQDDLESVHQESFLPGQLFSLVTNAGARYEGKIYNVLDSFGDTRLTFSDVFGMDLNAPWWKFHKRKYAFLTFKASEIQDIEVLELDDSVVALASSAGLHTPAQVGALHQQKQSDLESIHPLIGRLISLETESGALYEGRLYDVFPHEPPSVTLSDVRNLYSPALSHAFSPLFDHLLTFKSRDNQDLQVNENGVIVSHVTASGKREFLTFNSSEIQDIEVFELDESVANDKKKQSDLESVHPLIGRLISLETKSGARYEGRLDFVFPPSPTQRQSVTLRDNPQFDFLTFETTNIRDLRLNEDGVIVSHVTASGKSEVIAFFALDCESINLGHRSLSEDEMMPLLLSFSRGKFVKLKRMVLSGNGIRGTRAKLIGEGLKICNSLGELNLGNNQLGFTPWLGEGLKVNSSLQWLNLENNQIGDVGAVLLGEWLEVNSSVQYLNLRNNKVGDTGAAALGKGLKVNSSLWELDLGSNRVGDFGAAALAEALKFNSSLQGLDLSNQRSGPFEVSGSAFLMRGCQNLNYLIFECSDWRACVASDSWGDLPVPPAEVISRGTRSVFEFVKDILHGGSFISCSCRLMVVGPQLVGKTSLVNALKYGMSKTISLNDRTMYVQCSRQLLDGGVDLRVWDFAGQEVYYLSHSVHFTQRCLYILTWTPPQPASHAVALSPPQTLAHLISDLCLWLQMLAQHVPNAKVLLVGTRDDGSGSYLNMQAQVESAVDAEIAQLNLRVEPECRQLRCMEQEILDRVAAAKERWIMSKIVHEFERRRGDESDYREQEMEWWVYQSGAQSGLEEWQKIIAREVADGMQRVQMLRQRIELMEWGRAQLERVPKKRSFTLDCLNGRGVAELLTQLSGLCSSHVLGMKLPGEKLPGWWLLALKSLQDGGASEPMSKVSAVERIRREVPALSSPQEHPDTSILVILRFWADLGRIFMYGDFVLPDPLRLIDLIKPLLHHDPLFLMDNACPDERKALLLPSCHELSLRGVCFGFLRRLKNQAVLDRRLLSLLPAWTLDVTFHETMLKFFADCHFICFIRTAAPDASEEILVTARSRDLPPFHALFPPAPVGLSDDDREKYNSYSRKHDALCLQFNSILKSNSSCRALFLVSRYHIGIISRLQAFIHSTRPNEISIVSKAAKDCLFMCRGQNMLPASNQPWCAVRVIPSCNDVEITALLSAFIENDGPLSRNSDRLTKCAVFVAANDLALFAFMARCIEDTLRQWSICAECDCYVQGPSDYCPFILFCKPLSIDCCPLTLSAVLTGNAWNTVVPGVLMRDLFPSQRRCAMFLSYTSDKIENTGTQYACEIIRNGFQKAALCSVWMDRADAYDCRRQALVRENLQAANMYILCLTPLYLTRPSCLTELNYILTLVETLPERKRLYIMPLHPAVTASGLRRIFDCGFVLLPDFQASSLSNSIVRKHFLSDFALALLRRLCEHYKSEADPLAVQCLNTEPWLSTSLDMMPNRKWNGVEATLDMCRAIVVKEGQSLGSLLVCSDDRPIQGLPFLDEINFASEPPSLEALDPAFSKSFVVDSMEGFNPILIWFRKQHAVHLAECGISSHQLCALVKNFSESLQSLPIYLQHLLKDVDFTHAQNSFGGSEDLADFLDWTATPPQVKGTRKVVFRVEGHDDKLLLNAILRLKFPMLQRPAGHFWSDFSYNSNSSSLKIKDCKLLTDKIHEVGIVSIVRSLQATAGLKSFVLSFLDLDDQDLKAFETRPKQRPDKELCFFTWRWGRAIENYLLPVTAPAALYVRTRDIASKLTAEVFVTLARHFFPVVSDAESKKGKLCGHVALKFNDIIGPGWKSWSDLLQSPDVNVHKDTDTLAAAETLKRFSISLLGVAKLLVERHTSVYGSSGSRADEWLLHLAAVRREVREGKYDIRSARGRAEIHWKSACAAILDLPAIRPGAALNRGDTDDTALWFNLPAVCSFLANLCSCSWLSGAVDDPVEAVRVKDAAASALYLVQHALCVLLLGCDPESPAPQCTLFSSACCCCFLPLVGEKSAASCFTCGCHDALHTLPERDLLSSTAADFFVELCRVGSIGWHSHKFMEAVYGRTHLGVEFSEAKVKDSYQLYEQHVRPLLYGGAIDSDMTLSALPEITVYAKEGQMKPLLEQRRAEFDRLCGLISVLIDAPTPLAASPGASTSSGSEGASVSDFAAVSQARPAFDTMTARDVATAIGLIGPPYKAYEQSIVDNGVDGKLVIQLVGLPEAEALRFLENLGILPPAHSRRVLMLFRS